MMAQKEPSLVELAQRCEELQEKIHMLEIKISELMRRDKIVDDGKYDPHPGLK